MTEERKQELRQLLNEARGSLEMRPYGGDGSVVLPVNKYKRQLQKCWTFYSERPLIGTIEFLPYIANEVVKSKLLDFIRAQFRPLIHEDKDSIRLSFRAGRTSRWISSGSVSMATSEDCYRAGSR